MLPLPDIFKEFAMDGSFLFLNSGSSSISPLAVQERIHEIQKQAELNPTAAIMYSYTNLWAAQSELAKFLHANPGDIFLRHNISEVMNNLILGLPLDPGSEILYSDLEYGAVKITCRFRAERDSLELREFKAPRPGDNYFDKIIQAISPATKMLVLSHVYTANGLILPIEDIAYETRKRGIFLLIDGAHSIGSLPLDFRKFHNIDGYGGNLHKWLMGPKGSAFGWVNPLHQDKIQPIQAGWTSYEYLPEHAGFGAGSRFQGKFALIGTLDYSSFLAIPAILAFWQKHGPEKIRARINGLQKILRHGLADSNLKIFSPPESEESGPLLAYQLQGKYAQAGFELMHQLYAQEKLQISLPFLDGARCLRLSPHIYNTPEEMYKTVEILTRFFKN